MPGAAVLCARAALRSGIGMIRLFVAPENVGAVVSAVPSAMISSYGTGTESFSETIEGWADALVIGPGLGNDATTRSLVEKSLVETSCPVLLDADALNVFAGDIPALSRLLKGREALITPHPAELARLLATTTEAVLGSVFDAGTALARELGAAVLLKGTPTVVFAADGARLVSARGTAALATGGSGDLLSGIAGTLLAQTHEALSSGACAAWIHGRAAELCGYVRGTTLEDVLFALPRAWNEKEHRPAPPVLASLPAVSS